MDKRVLKPEDLYSLQTPAGAQVSPDGKYVVYTVTRIDKDKDKGFTDLFLYEAGTERRRRLTYTGQEGTPRFSPDGSRLAFISGRKEKGQIFVLDLNGGEAWHLPTAESVSAPLLWFPDGKRLAYTAKVFSKPENWVPYPGAPEYDAHRLQEIAKRANEDKKPDSDKKQNEVRVITRFKYRGDGTGYFGDLRTQVFICDVPSASPLVELETNSRQITSGDYDHSSMTISPDGRYMAVDAKRSESSDLDNKGALWLLDIETGETSLLYDAPGPARGPLWSPCGQHLAFWGDDNRCGLSTTTDLYVLNLGDFLNMFAKGESPQALDKDAAINVTRQFDRGAGGPAFWSGDQLFFLLADRGTYIVSRTTGCGKVTTVLKDYDRSIGGIHGKGEFLVYTASQINVPEELYLSNDGQERLVSNVNTELAERLEFGAWEKITYPSDDGQDVDGWIIYPTGFTPSEKYPLVLMIHGGPHGWYGPQFMAQVQQFAGRGYAVLITNPRGSESYGQDFACIIDKNWGDRDYADVMAGVDHVLGRGFIDKDNMFVYGWSYGGYLTCWVVTQTHRFKAACAGASVTNLLSDYGTSDITLADEWEYGGQPWKDGAHLLAHSPLSFADNVTTPILLMHGDNDMRVPIGQTEEFYVSLKRMNKAAVMIRYPGEFHGPRRPLHRVDLAERLLAWFDYHKSQKG